MDTFQQPSMRLLLEKDLAAAKEWRDRALTLITSTLVKTLYSRTKSFIDTLGKPAPSCSSSFWA
jgi:hypothetical protein